MNHNLLRHLELFLDRAERAHEEDSASIWSMPTGLRGLDDITGGLEPGLHAIVGRTGVGVTALVQHLIVTASLVHRRPAGLVLLGQPACRRIERLLARVSELPVDTIHRAALNDDDWFRLSITIAHLAGAPLEIIEAFDADLPDPCDVLAPLPPGIGLVIYDSIDSLPNTADVAVLRSIAIDAQHIVVIVHRGGAIPPGVAALCDTIHFLSSDGTGPYLQTAIHRRLTTRLPRIPLALRFGTWDLVEVPVTARPPAGTPQLPYGDSNGC